MAQRFADNFLNLKYGNDDITNRTTQSRAPALSKVWTVVQGSGGASQEARFTLAGEGTSASTLAVAQTMEATKVNGNKFAWSVPYAKTEGSITVPYDDIVVSRKESDAATRALEDAIDSGLERFGVDLQGNLLGTPGLSKGRGTYNVSAVGAAPVFAITLNEPADAANFSHGDQVVLDAAADGQTLLADVGYVVDVDTDTGFIQVAATSAPNTPASPGASWVDTTVYYVFKNTIVQPTATTYDTAVVPMGAYLPATRATDTFLGVDRSLDSRLSGNRSTSGTTMLQKLRGAIAKMANRSTDMFADDICVVMNIEDVESINDELMANNVGARNNGTSTTDGYISFMLQTSLGSCAVMGDRKKSKGTAFVLNKRHLKLHAAGNNSTTGANLCHLVKTDGVNVLRAKDTTNDMEVRPYSRIAHTIGAPYMHSVVTF